MQEGFRAGDTTRLLGAIAEVARRLLSPAFDAVRRRRGRVLNDPRLPGLGLDRPTGAGEERLNPIWVAPDSFTKDVPFTDRLDDLLVFGLATGRITDQEAEVVETALADEARGRHTVERQWDEDYQRWLAEVAARSAGRRSERPKVVQPFTVLDAKPAAHEPRQLHLLVNRIPTLEELSFHVVDGVAVAERDGYVVHFACDLPGVFVEGHVGDLWKVTLEGGSARAVLGRGVGGAEVANRARPELAAVDVVLSTNRRDYGSDRASCQYPGTITGRLAEQLYGRFPDLARQQQFAIAQQAVRIEQHGLDLAERRRGRQGQTATAGASPRHIPDAAMSHAAPRRSRSLRSGG